MATISTKAGPWNMHVFSFGEGDPDNPLGRVGLEDIARIPFGAVELDHSGKIVAYNDTEPDDGGQDRAKVVGTNFFDDVLRVSSKSIVIEEFRKGVQSRELNVVFDCTIPKVPFKVRIHLKISPILGTFWVFIKRLQRNPGT
jgi:photoactive yellow protein